MATNSVNSNYFSVASYSNKGMSGLISGMDTENMVKQMLSGTQSKIDKQNALRQQTLWRQEFYREMITSINSVRDKYFNTAFDASPVNNLASGSFFNSMLSTVTAGSAVKVVSTTPGAAAGDMNIQVQQLATATSLSSEIGVGAGNKITGGAINTANMIASMDKTLALNVGSTSVYIDLNGIGDRQAMVDKINSVFEDPNGDGDKSDAVGASAKIFDNKLRLISDNPGKRISVRSNSSYMATQMTGLSYSTGSSALSDGTGQMLQGGTNVNANAGLTLTVNLDGVEKQIILNPTPTPGSALTTQDIADSLQEELNRTFGTYINVTLDQGDLTDSEDDSLSLELDFNGELGHALTVYGVGAGSIGITPGASSRISTASKLADLGVVGERFTFDINGKTFSFSKDDSIGTMLNRINTANAGAQMSFSSISNTFKLTATSTGQGFNNYMNVSQSEGDLLGTIFRKSDGSGGDMAMFEAGSAAASQLLTVDTIAGNKEADIGDVNKGAQFKINVNGQTYTHTLTNDDPDVKTFTVGEIVFNLNTWLADTFGENSDPNVASGQNIYYNAIDGRLEVTNGAVVKFDQTAIDTENATILANGLKTDIALALGLNKTAKSNLATAGTALADIYQLKNIADQFDTASGASTGASTLADLTGYGGAGGGALRFADGRLVLEAPNNGTVSLTGDVDALFGGIGSLSDSSGAIVDSNDISAGQDAIISVNGVQTSRASNLFEIDGVTIQAVAVSNGTDTVINTQRDTETIVSSIKTFVEDYNKMVDTLNGYVNAEATYKDYAPLTSEQKQEMSDREIELWEENAKTGLLRGDSATNDFLNGLYALLYNKPVTSAYALYDVGLEAVNYKEPGKLTFDEAAFRNALAADPGSVQALFSDPNVGIAKQMSALMDRAAKVSVADPGSLVAMAGVKGSSTEYTSTIYSTLASIDDRLEDLRVKYEKERTRYWNQFNEMEKIMANYQAQSNYISQMMVSGEY